MTTPVVQLQANNTNRLIVGPCILLKTTTVAQQVRALRPLKKQESTETTTSQPEFLRCKRRADFSKLGLNLPKVHPVASSRRNARERNRVKQVNNGFDTLRQRVPNGKKNKKMSKVDTLRAAVEYIKSLQELLQNGSTVSSGSDTTMSSDDENFSAGIQTHSMQTSMPSVLVQEKENPQDNIIHSPGPSECSDSCESSTSSFEDRDLCELSNWIDALCGVNIS